MQQSSNPRLRGAQSVLLNAESDLSTPIYGTYDAAYNLNKNVIPRQWTLARSAVSAVQRVALAADKGLDFVQQCTGYPGASPNDEGIPITPIPSVIYPLIDVHSNWHQNKWSSTWNRQIRPGRHPNGKEDYAD